jgi:hypothetical protein
MPRELAAEAAVHWRGDELVKAVATMLGESLGFVGAWHDNLEADGKTVTSRDCGVMQISIPAHDIGTSIERALRTASESPEVNLDPKVYLPILHYNLVRGRALYDQPWSGKAGIRLWQPWNAYTDGWATFPGWWVWAQPSLDHWAPTGRYIHRAIVGVANYHLLIAEDMNQDQARTYAQAAAKRFGVLGVLGSLPRGVYWCSIPPCPTVPPTDKVGPRPVPNEGV